MESCRRREKIWQTWSCFCGKFLTFKSWTEDLGEFFESQFAILDHSLRSKTHVILNAMPKMCQAFLISLGVTYHIVNSRPGSSYLKVHSPWFRWILATSCDVVNPTGAMVILEGNGNIPYFRTKCRWGEIIITQIWAVEAHITTDEGKQWTSYPVPQTIWLDTAIKNERKVDYD